MFCCELSVCRQQLLLSASLALSLSSRCQHSHAVTVLHFRNVGILLIQQFAHLQIQLHDLSAGVLLLPSYIVSNCSSQPHSILHSNVLSSAVFNDVLEKRSHP